jgi:hypothetical protein
MVLANPSIFEISSSPIQDSQSIIEYVVSTSRRISFQRPGQYLSMPNPKEGCRDALRIVTQLKVSNFYPPRMSGLHPALALPTLALPMQFGGVRVEIIVD